MWWWPGTLLPHFLVEHRSNGSNYFSKLSRSWINKAVPNLQTSSRHEVIVRVHNKCYSIYLPIFIFRWHCEQCPRVIAYETPNVTKAGQKHVLHTLCHWQWHTLSYVRLQINTCSCQQTERNSVIYTMCFSEVGPSSLFRCGKILIFSTWGSGAVGCIPLSWTNNISLSDNYTTGQLKNYFLFN